MAKDEVNRGDWRSFAESTLPAGYISVSSIPVLKPDPYAEIVPSAKGNRTKHVAGEMNKIEGRYASHLEIRKLTGEILEWRFEQMKLCLAKATYLTIDFLVVLPRGVVELHEVKGGHWEDDARAKIKMAAQMFPWWTIYGVTWDKQIKDWKFERIGRRGESNG